MARNLLERILEVQKQTLEARRKEIVGDWEDRMTAQRVAVRSLECPTHGKGVIFRMKSEGSKHVAEFECCCEELQDLMHERLAKVKR